MTTGMTMPGWSLVVALNSLQNAMILTPCWPRAGPTGGAGLACPAGICNLICPVIFFAIGSETERWNMGAAECRAGGSQHDSITRSPRFCSLYFITPLHHQSISSRLLHLPVFQFDGSIAAINVHGDFQFAPVRLEFLNHTAEVKKWAIVDLHRFADIEADLWLLMLFGGRDLRLDRLDLLRRGRRRRLAAYETNDALGFFDKVPGFFKDPVVFIEQHHINENVAWPELAG